MRRSPTFPGSPSNKDNQSLIHKTPRGKTKARWLVLFLCCVTTFGSFFCFDNPQALQAYIVPELNINSSKFNQLYSVYAIPNIFLPFFSGVIIDYFDSRTVLFWLSVLVTIGQVITTLGVFYSNLFVMLVGRLIFGFGGESLNIARSTMLTEWFFNKELGSALGTALSIGFLGTSLNSWLSPRIYLWTAQLYYPFFVGALFCFISCIAAFTVWYVDKNAKGTKHTNQAKNQEFGTFGFKRFKYFSLEYYLLLFASLLLYGCLYGLRDNLNDLLVHRFGFLPEKAGYLILHVYLFPTLLTPFIGVFIDKFGHRVLLVLCATFMFVLEMAFLTFVKDSLNSAAIMLPGLIVIGLFHAAFAVVFWSSIPKILATKDVSLAFGVATSLQNLVLATVPMLIGLIHDKTMQTSKGYFWSIIPLFALAILGFGLIVWLWIDDTKHGKRLNRSKSGINETEMMSMHN